MFQKTSFTTLIVGVFIVYVLHTCWVMYGIVYTKPCDNPKSDKCISPYLAGKPRLQLSIYTALRPNTEGGHSLIHREEDFDVNTRFERLVNVSLPKKTRKNGTLYAMVFVHQAGMSPWQDPRQVHMVTQLTAYMLPKPPEVSLITGEDEAQKQEQKSTPGDDLLDRPVSHWRSRLTLNIVAENFLFDREALPSDVHRYMKLRPGQRALFLSLNFSLSLSLSLSLSIPLSLSLSLLPCSSSLRFLLSSNSFVCIYVCVLFVIGVYAFGFLFMLPQLFVNYKLKSVAHLPWKAFMYKAFNTFIDDVFAFIITMPTSHRLACFRDDAVFLIYLYQRWLYPVDKTRVNEYGVSYDEDLKGKAHKD
uniref:Lipid scramblase CLPTM1L n=1 Tax=Astyanax mexicanus TaxID=7994 RepID=A0A8B9KIZ5_ASTMX